MIESAKKRLSENDLGLTQSHQSGFLIPKLFIRDGLFDSLTNESLNPRRKLRFYDADNGTTFSPNFIYYNNKFFGGTRHEYRLTGLTNFIRDHRLKLGDSVVIKRLSTDEYEMKSEKKTLLATVLTEESWIAIYGENKDDRK
jgi:hypothetical protein